MDATLPILRGPAVLSERKLRDSQGSPNDADAVVLLGTDFADRVARGNLDAIELSEILGMRPTEHLFAAEDRRDWDDWIHFFSRTSDPATRKGLVEVVL